MKTLFNIALVVLLLSISVAPVRAQIEPEDIMKMSLEELMNMDITTASKKAESINEAPGIITVVPRQEIDGFAAENLGQILNRVVGMQFLSVDFAIDQSIVVRGQEMLPYNNHVLILLDGRPVRDPITGGNNSSVWTTFPIDTIDHIEVVRGPGSVLYGSCAYSGVVNIITNHLKEDGYKGRATIGAGGDGLFTQEVNGVFRQGDLEFQIGLEHLDENGQEYGFHDYQDPPVYESHHFGRKTTGVYSELAYKGFALAYYYGDFQPYSLTGNPYWNHEDGYENIRQTTRFANLGWSGELTEKLGMDANATHNIHRWVGASPPGHTDGESLLCEISLDYQIIEGFNAIVGGVYEDTDWEGVLVNEGEQESHSLYSQIDYRVVDWLKLIGGVQYNKIEGVDSHTSPRLGVVANMTEHLGAKLLYSQAFRRGYPNETSFFVTIFRGNPSLEPELIDTYEAQLFYQTKKMQHSLTYFQSKMRNIITRDYSDPPWIKYINSGDWKSRGVEYEGRISLTERILATGSVSYQTNKKNGMEDASLHPNWLVKAGLLYTGPQFTLGVFDAFSGSPEDVSKVNPAVLEINKEAESYHLVSAKVSCKLPKFNGKGNLTLSLEADNILDEDIRYPDYANKKLNTLLPLGNGTTWWVGLTCDF